VRDLNRKAFKKQKESNPTHVRDLNRKAFKKQKESNPTHVRDLNSKAFEKQKESNPTHVRDLNTQAFKKRKESNPTQVRSLNSKAFLKTKENNLEHVRELNKNAQNRKRFQSTQLHTTHHEPLQPARKKQNCTVADGTHEMNMTNVIQSFHDNIKCGPEYICTCCDQLWYRSSVTKCDANKYTKCTKHLLDVCITGKISVDNMEWVCSTCHSNLSDGKLPVCSKADKMNFPVKPECLNLTPLEERLISPRIAFMQIHELPRGGQLSIHGNVVNVPADVNSVVNTLPRPVNESQTIPIKLKRKLSYKHHYQFQSVRPRKVLEAAKHLVETSELFQKEHIEVQENWLSNVNSASLRERGDWEQFVNSSTSTNQIDVVHSSDEPIEPDNNTKQLTSKPIMDSKNNDGDDDDGWSKVEDRPSGVTDTLLQEPDMTENIENIISFAQVKETDL